MKKDKDKGIKFETLKKPRLIRNLVILFMITFIGSAIYFKTSSAKYQTTQVIPIINTKVVNKPWWTLTIKESGKEDKVLKSGPGITENNYIFDYQLEDGYGISSFTCIRRDKTPVLDTEITITIENNKFKITDSAKKRGTVCEVNIAKLDNNPPTPPTMSYSNGTITLSGSTDKESKENEIKYYYKTDCTGTEDKENYTQASTIEVTKLNQATQKICAYAEDEVGNKSAITQKTLNIIASKTASSQTKYQCENGSYVDNTNACSKTENKEYTETYNQACTSVDKGAYGWSAETTTSNLQSCQSNSISCSATTVGQTNKSCSKKSQSPCPEGWEDLGQECYSGPIKGYDYYPSDDDAEKICESICKSYGTMWTGYGGINTLTCWCDHRSTTVYTMKEKTCEWKSNMQNEYAEPIKTGSSGGCSPTSPGCTPTANNCKASGTSCSSTTTCTKSCTASCTISYTGTLKYYCPITQTYYNTSGEATSACTNYCSAGTYYNTKCYNLTD